MASAEVLAGPPAAELIVFTRPFTRLTAFSFVVFDLGVGLSEVALRVLESAHQVVLVVTPELTNLKDSAELLQIFTNVLEIRALGDLAIPQLQVAN